MGYRIQVRVDGLWWDLRPSSRTVRAIHPGPYTFKTREEAQEMMEMCYLEQAHLSPPTARVVEVEE